MGGLLHGQQYNFIRYSLQEGLPQSQVFAATQDAKGYVWYGTQGGGITRFDGLNFETFTTKDGLPSNYINEILEDQNRHLWVGTNRGLGVYDGRKWRAPLKEDGIGLSIHALYLKNDSTLWLGSGKGIYSYSINEGVLQKLSLDPRLDKLGINDFLGDENGVWVASNSGVWQIGDTVRRYTSRNGLNGSVVQSLLKGSMGLLWIACFDGGVSVFDKVNDSFLPFKNPPSVKKALTLYQDESDNIWVGTRDKGLSIFHPQDASWTVINEKKGLPHNHIRKIFRDSWNNTWVCTSGGGVAKYLGQFFVKYDPANGLHGKYIYALATDKEGKLWIAASNNGLAVFAEKKFQKIDIDSGFIDVKSKAIVYTNNGIWVGTEGKGIVLIDSGTYRVFTEKDGLTSNWIRSMVEDDAGNIWVATHAKGIVEIKSRSGGNYQMLRHKTDMPGLYMSCIAKSPRGEIWFATQYGEIGFFKDEKMTAVYEASDGLPGVAVRSICFDSTGRIWLGMAGRGVYVADLTVTPIRFHPLETEKPLYSDNIYLLVFDRDGNLWAGSESGVDEISFNEAGIVMDVKHFGRNEGFLGIETCQNAGLLDKNGNVWFGTMGGLMKHSPTKEIKRRSVPEIHFEQISLFYQPLIETTYKNFVRSDGRLKAGLLLPYHKNHLNFAFKALNLSNPKGIQYHWRLSGIESDWSPFSAKASVDYSNLPPGDFSFEVQAKSADDHLSEVISTSFSIKKPFWQILWVQVLTGLVFLMGFFAWFWTWKRKLERKELARRKELEIKNNVLQLEQKALQLQMNPHFIFNALNSIQSLVATKDLGTARTQINNFATLMRGILSNSKQQKISLKEEVNVLEKYLQMEQFCQRVPFDFSIKLAPNIDLEEIEIPPMILQPFVENAVIHGIAHRSDKGEILISFEMKDDLFNCTIKDNGVGRKRAEALKQSRKPGHQSISMAVTRERLDALRGDRGYKSLETMDIISQEGNIIGTKIVVRIPVVLWENQSS